MKPVVFLPGFDGDARLRSEFIDALAARREVLGVSYPNRALGTLDAYRAHAMAQAPVDWQPVLVAESFSGLIAARWASIDPRVSALVLCASFARNPVGLAATLGARLPALVKMGPSFMNPVAAASGDAARMRWSEALSRTMAGLRSDVVAERLRFIADEDAGEVLAALRIPVLVVQFDGDRVVERSHRAHLESVCHNAQVIRLPGPHFALETRPRECAAAIDQHLGALFPEPT